VSQVTFDHELDSGLWLSVAELARVKSLSRQSVHERVPRLVETGTVVLPHGSKKPYNGSRNRNHDLNYLTTVGKPARHAPFPSTETLTLVIQGRSAKSFWKQEAPAKQHMFVAFLYLARANRSGLSIRC
jgi:hypothetical protein